MSKEEVKLGALPEVIEAEAPIVKTKAAKPDIQKKLEEVKVISDAVIPAGQLLVSKGREFIAILEAQSLVQTMVPPRASTSDKAEFGINGVKILVPTGKPVMVPESVAALIKDIYNYNY